MEKLKVPSSLSSQSVGLSVSLLVCPSVSLLVCWLVDLAVRPSICQLVFQFRLSRVESLVIAQSGESGDCPE